MSHITHINESCHTHRGYNRPTNRVVTTVGAVALSSFIHAGEIIHKYT